MPTGGMRLRVTPEGGVDFSTGGFNDLTTASQTGSQDITRQSIELLGNLRQLEDVLETSEISGEDVVGLKGFFKSLSNVTVAQVNEGAFFENRADFDRLTKLIRQTSLRVMSDESRFTEQDRDYIFDLFPSTGVFESLPNAFVKIRLMKVLFLRRLGPALAGAGNIPVGDAGLTTDEIIGFVERGELTFDEGMRTLETFFPEQFPPQ